MKSLIITATAALLTAGSAMAEVNPIVFNNPDNAPYWGLRASLDTSIPSKWHIDGEKPITIYRPGAGASFGAIYNLPLYANLYLEPGLSLFYDTYRYDDFVWNDDADIFIPETIAPRINKFGVRIPVNIGFHFDLFENCSINVFTGPEFNIGIAGFLTNLPDELEKDDDFDNKVFGKNGGHRRFDCAWSIGAGLDFGTYYVGISGAIGMTDIETGFVRGYDNRFYVTVGLNL